MVNESVAAGGAAPPTGRSSRLMVVLVAVVSGAAGAAVPVWWQRTPASRADVSSEASDNLRDAGQAVFVSFGDVTVNLNEGRMNRYLRLKISLQVDRAHEAHVSQAVARQQLILRNWLISHLSDKLLDEIRGAAGQNMLRREIRDHFNSQLFPDGRERILDVLFEEFNVQ